MSNSWQLMTLRDAGVQLIDCEHRTPAAADAGYAYIAIPQLKQGRIDPSDARRITSEHFNEWTRKARPRKHDVVLSRRCNPGETATVTGEFEFALEQNLVLLRADGSRLHPPFLRWLVRSPAWWDQIGKFLNVGAVFDSLRCADVPNFELPIPPVKSQQAIAANLGALDDKIELNRRMNETLEGMARALFKSWFVDFDPVRAKLDGRPPPNLDLATAALFPNSFEQADVLKVPRGWHEGQLSDVCLLKRGHDLPANLRVAGAIPVVSSSGVTGWHTEAKAKGLGVITGRYGTIGSVFLVDGDYWPLNTTLYVEDFRGCPPRFIFHLLGDIDYTIYSDKAAVPGVNRNHLHMQSIIIPPSPVQEAFADIVAPWWQMKSVNEKQSQHLERIRDSLLPRLLSGELRIPDAEKLLHNVI